MIVCAPTDLRRYTASGVEARLLTASDGSAELEALLVVQQRGFADLLAGPGAPTSDEVEALRRQIAAGENLGALARIDGAPASAGVLLPVGSIAELGGVATVPEYRRRGAAATVSSLLIRDSFEHDGRLVWLSAGDEAAPATYRKIGFQAAQSRLSYITRGGSGKGQGGRTHGSLSEGERRNRS